MNATEPDHLNGLDTRYLGYFDCFNKGLYFEAHEVLEGLWLLDRKGPDGSFYKGLIQLAGAFVHLQKNRPGPGASLFRLAREHLKPYPAIHYRLDVGGTLAFIQSWLDRLGRDSGSSYVLDGGETPKIMLLAHGTGCGTV